MAKNDKYIREVIKNDDYLFAIANTMAVNGFGGYNKPALERGILCDFRKRRT
jgi:hypothetical protein